MNVKVRRQNTRKSVDLAVKAKKKTQGQICLFWKRTDTNFIYGPIRKIGPTSN